HDGRQKPQCTQSSTSSRDGGWCASKIDAAVGVLAMGASENVDVSLARSLLKLRNMARLTLPSSWRRLHTDERRRYRALRTVRAAVRAKGAIPPQESAKAIGL